jgi:hypothetical protein
MHHAAFLAISSTAGLTWDRASLRPLVLSRLSTAKGHSHVSGLHALLNTEPKPEDLALLLEALRSPSPELKERGSHLVRVFAKGEIVGPAADAVLRLLDEKDPRVLREVFREIWGARVSPEVEARLLEIARSAKGELYHDIVYFALSTLRFKSKAVVEELARAAEQSDPGRAIWGLSHGVAPEAAEPAADLLIAVFEMHPPHRQEALEGLRDYGTAAHADRLEAIRDSPGLDPGLRGPVDQAIRQIRRRAGK